MKDFWAFLLQTLTASGAAVLVLAAKAIFRDKLSPRWQFASWGVLGVALLMPAGCSGRYALLDWPFFVETVKSALTGEYGTVTKVTVPVPLPFLYKESGGGFWGAAFGFAYMVYVAGVVFLLIRYAILYLRLRLVLKEAGRKAAGRDFRTGLSEEPGNGGLSGYNAQIFVDAVAKKYGLASCVVLEAEGLTTAFICGVFRPVLVLPAGGPVDEKVVLHELLHLKHHDVFFGLVICLFRCLHWCNPLLWVCANLAGNDLEAFCDQRVLERLSGEERRDYGRILLDMAGGKYAKMPGTSSVANGGKNIRRRIMAIARFKKYPAGMGLVSACILLVFSVPFLVGASTAPVFGKGSLLSDVCVSDMVRARMVRCGTYAGAFDTYAKAVLTGEIPYLAMCSPLGEQEMLAGVHREGGGVGSLEKMALPAVADAQGGYRIYNLYQKEQDVWEGLLVLGLIGFSGGDEDEADMEKEGDRWYAAQKVCARKEDGGWVVMPEGEFTPVWADSWALSFPDVDRFPAWCYEAEGGDFTFRMRWQTAASVESGSVTVSAGSYSTSFGITPQPDGVFSFNDSYGISAVYTGKPEDKKRYRQIGYSGQLVWDRAQGVTVENKNLYANSASRSDLSWNSKDGPSSGEVSGEFFGGGSDGSLWGSRPLEEDWGDRISLGGGGGGSIKAPEIPDGYVMKFYVNGKLEEELTLELMGGGELYE